MKNATYENSVAVFVPMLENLRAVLEKGRAHAEARKFDPAILVSARLAPDMFPLSLQVRIACDMSRHAVALLAGDTATADDHDDRTLDDLIARIDRAVAQLKSVDPARLEGAEDRDILLPLLPVDLEFFGSGGNLLREWSLPHFYFHVVTAYDILRHNGVTLGKLD